MTRLEQELRLNKIKGMAWLLADPTATSPTSTNPRQHQITLHLRSQDKKWKKITNNRFQGYGKKIERLIEGSVTKQADSFNNFQYQSLRQTQSNQRKAFNDHTNFTAKRTDYEGEIFRLKRKEKDIQNQIVKMEKLKEISGICQQKRNFYDGCVDRYFDDYRKDINKIITNIAEKNSTKNAQHTI